MSDLRIDKFYIEKSELGRNLRIAARTKSRGVPGGHDSIEPYYIKLGEGVKLDVPGLITDQDECVGHVTEEAFDDLAQQLWDMGYRPREALNHDEALKELRSERDFLRDRLRAESDARYRLQEVVSTIAMQVEERAMSDQKFTEDDVELFRQLLYRHGGGITTYLFEGEALKTHEILLELERRGLAIRHLVTKRGDLVADLDRPDDLYSITWKPAS